MPVLAVGAKIRGKRIKEIIKLSNGWYLIKTENRKSLRDFRVKTIFQTAPRIKSLTPKHAHFAIDFYGKLCADRDKAMKVFHAIIQVWQGRPAQDVLIEYQSSANRIPGYNLEYILYALNWILEQEDINFTGRPRNKQRDLDETLRKCNVTTPPNRSGSQRAISLFCNIVLGMHPVEAMIRVNLDVLPRKRAKGAV